MGCGTSFVKYVLFFFNLIVALLGLVVVGIGVAVLLKLDIIREVQSQISVAPWVFIIVGAIMFVISFFGCCGAIRESHCMVVTYAIFLLVIIIVQVILAVLIFTYEDNISSTVAKTVNGLFNQRGSASQEERDVANKLFENLQIQLECCGNNGPSDYGSATLPASCCSRDLTGGICVTGFAREGCSQRAVNLYRQYSKPIAGVAIGVACVEVIGALFALCLANSIRNMDRRSQY